MILWHLFDPKSPHSLSLYGKEWPGYSLIFCHHEKQKANKQKEHGKSQKEQLRLTRVNIYLKAG